MALDPRTPVIIGVGQVVQRAAGVDDAREPLDLMADAIRAAATDAGLAEVPAADSIRVVNLLSWRYRDPARLLAEALGQTANVRETVYTTASGNTPQLLVGITAEEIQAGQLDLAILTGGEAWRTRMRARRSDATLTWKKLPEGTEPTRTVGSTTPMNHPTETERGLVMPVQFYPMFETAIRAAAAEGVDEHQARAAELWSRFSAVASTNPYAWVRRALTPEEIATPGPDNRMIGFPYPKYMNSNNDVDQAAAVIVCSVERARSLGVPEDRWVFPHVAVDGNDDLVSVRDELHRSPAIRLAGERAYELAGVGPDDVDLVDLYSCFPSAVQVGAAELGFGLDRQLTRTGGLSFAGGPWNNYVMHGIATMVDDLREQPGATGLVWGNGGYLTKHGIGIYSTTPPEGGFRHDDVQDAIDAQPKRELVEAPDAAGAATIEAYTVMHDRDGRPEVAFAACRLPDGRRAWGSSADRDLAAQLCEGEWVGRTVTLDAEGVLAT